VVGEAAELTPVVCGVRHGRVVVAAELGLVVEVVRAGEGAQAAEAAELGSVVAAVRAVVAAQALAVPVAEVVQGAEHLEALLVQLALPERRERRPANG